MKINMIIQTGWLETQAQLVSVHEYPGGHTVGPFAQTQVHKTGLQTLEAIQNTVSIHLGTHCLRVRSHFYVELQRCCLG